MKLFQSFKLFFIFFLLFCSTLCFSQIFERDSIVKRIDSDRVTHILRLRGFADEITNKTKFLRLESVINPFYILDDYYFSNHKDYFLPNVIFDKCRFVDKFNNGYVNCYYPPVPLRILSIINSQSNVNVEIGGNYNPTNVDSLIISYNSFKNFSVIGFSTKTLFQLLSDTANSIYINGCQFKNGLMFANNSFKELHLSSCIFEKNTSLTLPISTNSKQKINIFFTDNKILNGRVSINSYQNLDTLNLDGSYNLDVFDKNGIVDALFSSTSYSNISKLSFFETYFGNNAKLAFRVDTVEFINCRNNQNSKPIDINQSFSSSKTNKLSDDNVNETIKICLVGSDVSLFNLFYSRNIEIIPFERNKNDNKYIELSDKELVELNITTFEQILEKFKNEGQNESFKRMDIQIRNYKHDHRENDIIETISFYFGKYFWEFGYNKLRPFLWLISALVFFSIINLFLWDTMSKTYILDPENVSFNIYPLKNSKRNNVYKVVQELLIQKGLLYLLNYKNYFWALFYTSSLFFSININSNRLHSKNNPFGVFVYLLQYCLGLFFIYCFIHLIFN